jgi:hypothetical protein
LAWGCGLDSTGSGQGPVAGCCECGDEPSGSCATELVRANYWRKVRIWRTVFECVRWCRLCSFSAAARLNIPEDTRYQSFRCRLQYAVFSINVQLTFVVASCSVQHNLLVLYSAVK